MCVAERHGVTSGKAHGTVCVTSDLFKVLPAATASLYDAVAVECTLSADVPLSWQGGDAGMPVKDRSETIKMLRIGVMLFLLISHPSLWRGNFVAASSHYLRTALSVLNGATGLGLLAVKLLTCAWKGSFR